MSKKKTQPCPECGGEMRYEKHSDEVTYLGHKRALDTLGWWCSKCGDNYNRPHSAPDGQTPYERLMAKVSAGASATS
ncbi:MAG: YgiT-type zinc finger protein [Polyangiaceae bacterium]|jgi:YgiT-type zinc finger domain-containing protein